MESFYGIMAMGFGLIIFLILILAAAYVFCSFVKMRGLKYLGSDKAWMAWIPFLYYYALSEVVKDSDGTLEVFGKKLPAWIFAWYWAASFVLTFIPVIGTLLIIASNIVFVGTMYGYAYAIAENKYLEETRVLGFVSGAFPIIAYVKFLTYK